MVYGRCVYSELYERVIQTVFLDLEFQQSKHHTYTSKWEQAPETHQGIKVQQNIPFPWHLGLTPRAAFRVYPLSEQEQRLVGFAFLVFSDYIKACSWCVRRREAIPQVR